MSKAIKILIGDPGAVKGVVGKVSGAEKAKEEAAAAKAALAAKEAGAPSAAGAQKARGLEDRQGRIEAAAAAAGVTRGENEADVLGRDNYAVKRKRASKDLLGA